MNKIKFKIATFLMIFALVLAASPFALAINEGQRVRFAGTVTAIDLEGQNFSVADRDNKVTVTYVNPSTEFELEKGKNFFGDDDIPFKELKVGDWVKVKSYMLSGKLEADEVDVYR